MGLAEIGQAERKRPPDEEREAKGRELDERTRLFESFSSNISSTLARFSEISTLPGFGIEPPTIDPGRRTAERRKSCYRNSFVKCAARPRGTFSC